MRFGGQTYFSLTGLMNFDHACKESAEQMSNKLSFTACKVSGEQVMPVLVNAAKALLDSWMFVCHSHWISCVRSLNVEYFPFFLRVVHVLCSATKPEPVCPVTISVTLGESESNALFLCL